MVKCSKAIAIMLVRFESESGKYYSATTIADTLQSLSFGGLSALFVEADFLKLALKCGEIREALRALFPSQFDFQKCKTGESIITDGPNKFYSGFQIKFNGHCNASASVDKTEILDRVGVLSAEILKKCERDVTISLIADTEIADSSTESVQSPEPEPVTPEPPSATKTPRSSWNSIRRSAKLKKLRSSLSYLKNKRNKLVYRERAAEAVEEAVEEEESVGQQLLKLIAKSNVYTEMINGKETLSVVTGLLVQDLLSNCGCSANKLPMIISTVITMLFGLVDVDSFRSIIRATDTFSLAAERTADIVVKNGRRRFIDRDAEDAILNAYLILDASNKKNKGFVAKPMIYEDKRGNICQGAFQVDNTVTKKAVGSAHLTTMSLEDELLWGLIFIFGGVTDAFGAAQEEMLMVMRYIDRRAREMSEENPDILLRKSTIIIKYIKFLYIKFCER